MKKIISFLMIAAMAIIVSVSFTARGFRFYMARALH